MSFRQRPRRSAMPLVFTIDGGQGFDCFFHRCEAKHALSVRQEGAGPGMLDHDRLPAGQIAEGPVADPGGLELYVGRFRAAELAARPLDIGLIALRRCGDFARMAHAPPVALEEALVLRVPLPEEERQLQPLARSARQLYELQK